MSICKRQIISLKSGTLRYAGYQLLCMPKNIIDLQ